MTHVNENIVMRQSIWSPRIAFDGSEPKHVALANAISEAIAKGELADEVQLPTHRALAEKLGVSVQTVSFSYQEVQRRGLIHSVVGRGSFVKGKAPAQNGHFMLVPNAGDDTDLSVVQAAYTSDHEQAARAVMASLATQDNGAWMNHARPVAGLERHREAALPLLQRLGCTTRTDCLVLTNGATHGVFLALAAVARPGDTVLTEAMTENGIIGAANVLGLNLRGLPTDEEGIVPDAFEAACAKGGVTALVWVPTFGNPTNHLAGRKRRERIAQIAQRHKVAVIEDEVYKPLLTERLPAITELLPELGFFCTSLTKSVMTGLRIGYLVAPHSFALRVAGLLRASTWSAPALVGEIAAQWLIDGTADRLIAVQQREAKQRYRMLVDAMGEHVERAHPLALSAWLRVPQGWNEAALLRVLTERKILVTPSAPFVVDRTLAQPGLRICTTGRVSPQGLASALQTMRDTFQQLPSLHSAEQLL
jgi:DNA-binding transcriptional MocR family regulator